MNDTWCPKMEISIQIVLDYLDNHNKKNHDLDWLTTANGDPEVIGINNIKPLNKAGVGDLTFCSYHGDKAVKTIRESKASYIICDYALNNEPPLTDQMFDMKESGVKRTLMFVQNPRLTFMRILSEFFEPAKPIVKIGKNCVIDPNVMLGLPGFGYERNEVGALEHFPHYGDVVINDNVDVGAHSCVDRATLPDEATVIGEGCKLDNFVHVAHNVKIGRNVLVVSHCNIGGSVEIGDGSYLAMSVTIMNKVKIGKRCLLGNRANIRKDVPDNSVVVGDDKIIGDVDEKESWKRLVSP